MVFNSVLAFPKGTVPGGSDGKSVCLQCRRPGFDLWVGKIPWRRKWQPTPVLLAGKSHGWRSLVDYNPWGHKESDTNEQLHFQRNCSVCTLNLWSFDTFVHSLLLWTIHENNRNDLVSIFHNLEFSLCMRYSVSFSVQCTYICLHILFFNLLYSSSVVFRLSTISTITCENNNSIYSRPF